MAQRLEADFLNGKQGAKSLNQRARLGELKGHYAQPREKNLALRLSKTYVERRNSAFSDTMFEKKQNKKKEQYSTLLNHE